MNTLSGRILWVIGLSWTFLFFSAEGLRVVAAGAPVFQSGPGASLLIELYSEPDASNSLPAEAWMKSLQKSEVLWKEFVPVIFRVEDSREYLQRQRNYERFWKSASAETPNFFLNGKIWKRWVENSSVPPAPVRPSGILKVENFGSGAFAAAYVPPKTIPGQWLVHAVLLGEDFSVLAYDHAQLRRMNGAFRAPVSLKSHNGAFAKPYAVAVWVTRDNSLIPVQAAGGYLPES